VQEQKRYIEQWRQELAFQRKLSTQPLHPASPYIHSIWDDDDNDEQQDVHFIHHSKPLIRADIFSTDSNHMSRSHNIADGE